MANTLKALDLFSGAGGAARGLQQAGFHVTGVDINPQPRYAGDVFIQADAMTFPLEGYDLIWASPPCQAYSLAARQHRAAGKEYPDLLAATRTRLQSTGAEYVIENVPGAPMQPTVKLNGWMFPHLKVIRERWFECSFFVLGPPTKRPRGLLRKGYLCVVGGGTPSWVRAMGVPNNTANECREAMGIDWMTRAELSQAIPPAYSEFLGHQARRIIGSGD